MGSPLLSFGRKLSRLSSPLHHPLLQLCQAVSPFPKQFHLLHVLKERLIIAVLPKDKKTHGPTSRLTRYKTRNIKREACGFAPHSPPLPPRPFQGSVKNRNSCGPPRPSPPENNSLSGIFSPSDRRVVEACPAR